MSGAAPSRFAHPCIALCDRAGKSRWLPAFVKVAAIGTLADVVPLVASEKKVEACVVSMLREKV